MLTRLTKRELKVFRDISTPLCDLIQLVLINNEKENKLNTYSNYNNKY